jgi:aspartate racemase
MHQIYDRIKNGQAYDAESWKKIEAEYREAGCQKVLLACTELSVIKADEGLEDWYMDPMDTLARLVIAAAGKEYK